MRDSAKKPIILYFHGIPDFCVECMTRTDQVHVWAFEGIPAWRLVGLDLE